MINKLQKRRATHTAIGATVGAALGMVAGGGIMRGIGAAAGTIIGAGAGGVASQIGTSMREQRFKKNVKNIKLALQKRIEKKQS